MQIRHVSIRNFRGIQELDWLVSGNIVCLIGPGNSKKTTILDAIEYALSPRWNLPIDDSDFNNLDVTKPIEITVTMGQLPEYFLKDTKFGLHLRGFADGKVTDEPDTDTDEYVLSLRLRVSQTLEPEWTVVNDRLPDGKQISARERERLAVFRLGDNVDRHLTWSRGSILLGITGSPGAASEVVNQANRNMRSTADFSKVDDLNTSLKIIADNAENLGVKPEDAYRPALDSRYVSMGMSAIAVHDGNVPLRMAGLGTRRLVAMAAQLSSMDAGACLLLDEVEHGLEPYRIRNLLRQFQNRIDNPEGENGQIIMTSHSPIVVSELDANQLTVVRSSPVDTQCIPVDPNLQATIRSSAEALLCPRIIVCEGKTEYGLCMGMEKHWTSQAYPPFAFAGVGVIEGGGTEASTRAQHLAGLGYAVCLFIDGDKLPDLEPLDSLKIETIYWDDGMCTEQRIASDLSRVGIQGTIRLATELHDPETIYNQLASKLGCVPGVVGTEPDQIFDIGFTEDQIRSAVASAALSRKKEWFKRIDRAELLAQVIVDDWAACENTDLVIKISTLMSWVYGS